MTTAANQSKPTLIHIGYIPLVDSAPLIVCKELGFAANAGIDLQLHRDVSWANIRDKLNVGHLDCAHMLAPMPIASSLGINHIREAVIAPITLSLNGNGITVSRALYAHMLDVGPAETRAGGTSAGRALARVVSERQAQKSAPLTLGIVYPFSCQHYEMRHWLTEAGLKIDDDVRLVGLPPQMMAESLAAGQIDGFCAGEPWNSVAVEMQAGCIVATKSELWGRAPEKVLGVRLSWAERHINELMRLIPAISQAAEWLAESANHKQAAELLCANNYLSQPADILLRSLSGQIVREHGKKAKETPGFLLFGGIDAHRPSRAHVAWILAMMYESGQLDPGVDVNFILDQVPRSDLYDRALALTDLTTSTMDGEIAARAGFDMNDAAGFVSRTRSDLN